MRTHARRNFRTILADKIESNGGYFDRDGRHVLSWCVPAYGPAYGLGPLDIVQELVKQGDFTSPADVLLRFPDVEKIWDGWFNTSSYFYEHLAEDMQSSVHDAETYRMWSPDIARKYRFSYTGLGAEKPFAATFEFRGRGGKHLCVTEFDGVALSGRNFDASELPTYPILWVRRLCGMIEEWDKCFTPQAAQDEARYLSVWRFAQWLEYVEGKDEAEDEAA